MNVLVISGEAIYPPDSGGKQVVFTSVKGLAQRGHDVTVMSAAAGRDSIPELESYCRWVPGRAEPENSYFGALKNLLSQKPYPIKKYSSDGNKKQLKKIINSDDIDIALIEGLHTTQYGTLLSDKYNIPVVYRSHNIETDILRDVMKSTDNLAKKIYLYIQTRKMKKYESETVPEFNKAIMISEEDQTRIHQMCPDVNSSVVPPGIDIDYFSRTTEKVDDNTIVFLGSLDWPPNVDGFRWFYSNIYPKIKEQIPNVSLLVVGKNPPESIQEISNQSVEITGFVEDIRPYVEAGSAFVAPIRMGSGVRIKVLNAMALGLPVVSTSLGAQGIECENGTNIQIADEPDGFASATVEMIRNPEKGKEIGEGGRKLVEEVYSIPRVAEKLEKEMIEVVENENRN
ncbi:glycosyltransferase involved in cell wall biosynthesis [Haloarcula quadrata]|uniref:Glycosyltransferase involved in cell wall biosynthesis n=1 Tax=Haloarcula quadrata TaxID=182779 RepID=A0A495R7D6_9EURY|nr:glycosyltransferase [Haloarcula quadrata]RKS83223.1 glycosyltransferase involved in cell wall biosynthesis [Haloarcula quadrata]